MRSGLWLCGECRSQISVCAGAIFQDSHLPLTVWFRATWYVTSQKNGVSALGLRRALGLGSYRTAWAMLHKLRRAMVRPGRERLRGTVEADETYWGGADTSESEGNDELSIKGGFSSRRGRIGEKPLSMLTFVPQDKVERRPVCG